MANPYFNAAYYLANNPDVATSGLDAETHYLQFGAKEGRAPTDWFNGAYYLAQNPDLQAGGITIETAFAHFQAFGSNEGRSPSPTKSLTDASLSGYAAANPDVAQAFGITDPAYLTSQQKAQLSSHFYQFGVNENRPGDPFVAPVGGTFTLTAGADDLTGTAGNDVFTANQVAGATAGTFIDTLQNVDLLNGGGGADLLKATITGTTAAVTAATTSIETIEIRNVAATQLATVAVAKDVTSVVEANSTAAVKFTGAAGVTSVTSGGAKALNVEGIEAAAVTVKVAKAADAATNTVTLQSVSTKAAALSALNVEVKGTVVVAAQNNATVAADTVKTLTVAANGAGAYKATGTSTADNLTFANTSQLTAATITGTGDLVLSLGTTQAKLASFDASGLAGGVVFTTTDKLDGGTASVLSSVKGGSGNDILAVANLKDGATVDLGAGDNKLAVTSADGGLTVTGGAGKDDITLDVNFAGKATVVTTGAGNDKLTITTPDYTTASTTLTVDLGEGDDFVNAGNLAGAISTINFQGGAGTDTIRITGDFGLAEANRIDGFETVDVTGNTGATGLDLSREASINAVVLTAGAATAKVLNAAAGTTITAKDGVVGTLNFALANDTGTADVAKVTLSADDSANKTGTADTAKQAELGLTANKIETVEVNSTALPGVGDPTAATPVKANKASDYTNTLTLTGDEVKTVVVTGDAKADLSVTGVKLATVDATGNTAGVTFSSVNTNAVTFNGGSGADVITSTIGHMVIKGGAGADTYAITQGATTPANDVKDTIVITSAADTQLATKANATTGALELDLTKMDVITSFGVNDKIDLSAFGFTGARTDAFVTATISTANADLLGLVKNGQADFFANGSVDAGVAQFTVAGATYLAIDANKDGNFSADSDGVILIGTVTGIDAGDVIWAA